MQAKPSSCCFLEHSAPTQDGIKYKYQSVWLDESVNQNEILTPKLQQKLG